MKSKYTIREFGVISDGLSKNPYNSDSIEVDQKTFESLANFIEENYENKDFESARFVSQIEYEKCMKYSSNDSDLCKTLLDN